MASKTKTAKKTTKSTPKGAKKGVARRSAANAKAPAARHTLTPYLSPNNATRAIEWYVDVFGAKKVYVAPGPDGKSVMHAHLKIGDSDLFLSDIFPGSDISDATRVGPTSSIHLWSKNADKWWKNAVANGAKVTMPLDDQFWGDRYGKLIDPFGVSWSFAWKSKLGAKELEAKRVEAMKAFGAPPA